MLGNDSTVNTSNIEQLRGGENVEYAEIHEADSDILKVLVRLC